MTIDASETLTDNEKIQYIHTLLLGKALRQFGTFSEQVVSTTMAHLNQVVLGLGMFFSVKFVSKQKFCDATLSEEATRIKSNLILYSYDLY